MKAITVKYFGPTGNRGIRIKASDSDGNAVTIRRGARRVEDDYDEAVKQLCHKMGWQGTLVRGSLGSDTEVYVWADGGRVTV